MILVLDDHLISANFFPWQPALFQGVPKLAWRTEAFSGELPGALVLDFALWDQNDEVAWHCSKVVTARPLQSSPSPEVSLKIRKKGKKQK